MQPEQRSAIDGDSYEPALLIPAGISVTITGQMFYTERPLTEYELSVVAELHRV